MRRAPWITASRSGWIAAVRGRNATGVRAAKFAAFGFRAANKPPPVRALRSAVAAIAGFAARDRALPLAALPVARPDLPRGRGIDFLCLVMWLSLPLMMVCR